MTAGRPAFKPTARDRQSVERMKACGEADETVAMSLGITLPTLKKYFASELEHGWARTRRWVLNRIFDGVVKGTPGLVRRAEELTSRRAVPAGDAVPSARKAMGKKEVVRLEAMVAGSGSEWGDDLKPPEDALPN